MGQAITILQLEKRDQIRLTKRRKMLCMIFGFLPEFPILLEISRTLKGND